MNGPDKLLSLSATPDGLACSAEAIRVRFRALGIGDSSAGDTGKQLIEVPIPAQSDFALA